MVGRGRSQGFRSLSSGLLKSRKTKKWGEGGAELALSVQFLFNPMVPDHRKEPPTFRIGLPPQLNHFGTPLQTHQLIPCLVKRTTKMSH